MTNGVTRGHSGRECCERRHRSGRVIAYAITRHAIQTALSNRSQVGDGVAVGDRAGTLPVNNIHVLADELDRTVRHQDMDPAHVQAAGGPNSGACRTNRTDARVTVPGSGSSEDSAC